MPPITELANCEFISPLFLPKPNTLGATSIIRIFPTRRVSRLEFVSRACQQGMSPRPLGVCRISAETLCFLFPITFFSILKEPSNTLGGASYSFRETVFSSPPLQYILQIRSVTRQYCLSRSDTTTRRHRLYRNPKQPLLNSKAGRPRPSKRTQKCTPLGYRDDLFLFSCEMGRSRGPGWVSYMVWQAHRHGRRQQG